MVAELLANGLAPLSAVGVAAALTPPRREAGPADMKDETLPREAVARSCKGASSTRRFFSQDLEGAGDDPKMRSRPRPRKRTSLLEFFGLVNSSP